MFSWFSDFTSCARTVLATSSNARHTLSQAVVGDPGPDIPETVPGWFSLGAKSYLDWMLESILPFIQIEEWGEEKVREEVRKEKKRGEENRIEVREVREEVRKEKKRKEEKRGVKKRKEKKRGEEK